jgi:hypothetical protein
VEGEDWRTEVEVGVGWQQSERRTNTTLTNIEHESIGVLHILMKFSKTIVANIEHLTGDRNLTFM